MGVLDGRPGGAGLHTIVNENAEIRGLAMVQAKSYACVQPIFEGIAEGLRQHGHEPTKILYSDDPKRKSME